jgi:hypothetical protein
MSPTGSISHAWLAFALLVGLVFLPFRSASAAQPQETCPGPLIEPHNAQVYDFKTSSRVEPYTEPNSHFHFMIIGCVENDMQDPLTVHWPVPVPSGFPNVDGDVPPNAKLDLLPKLIVTDDVAQAGSCVRYGDSGTMKRAMMLVPKALEDVFRRNDPGDCSRVVATAGSEDVVPIENYAQKFTNYFPSFAAEAKSTMLRFSASLGVTTEKDGGGYRSFVQYTMEPYDGSKGQPTQVRFIPEFQFPTDATRVFVDFDRKYDGSIQGKYDGEISFQVKDVHEGRLSYAALGVRDMKGERVGSIPIPVFLPAR